MKKLTDKKNVNGKQDTRPVIYTPDFVLSELKGMIAAIKKSKRIIYIGQLFENKFYTHERFSEWAKKFVDNSEKSLQISQSIRRIEKLLESRVVVGAMNKKLSDKMVKFHLINNYGWKDKTETQLSGSIGLGDLLDEAAKH